MLMIDGGCKQPYIILWLWAKELARHEVYISFGKFGCYACLAVELSDIGEVQSDERLYMRL